jgi:hypothetical protein
MALINFCFQYFAIDQKDLIWQELHNFSRKPIVISVCNIIGHSYESCTRMWGYYIGIRNPNQNINPFKQKLFDWSYNNESNAITTFKKHWTNFKDIQSSFIFNAKQNCLGASLDYICISDYNYFEFNKQNVPIASNLLNLKCKCPMDGVVCRKSQSQTYYSMLDSNACNWYQ